MPSLALNDQVKGRESNAVGLTGGLFDKTVVAYNQRRNAAGDFRYFVPALDHAIRKSPSSYGKILTISLMAHYSSKSLGQTMAPRRLNTRSCASSVSLQPYCTSAIILSADSTILSHVSRL